MTERPSQVERYQGMSPKERNIELKRIFIFLPFYIGDLSGEADVLNKDGALSDEFEKFIKDVDEKTVRRSNSVLKKELNLRLQALLPFAETTESFKSDVIEEFNDSFLSGVMRHGENLVKAFHLNDSKGGMFNKETAKGIEHRDYQLRILGWQITRIVLGETSSLAEDKKRRFKDQQRISSLTKRRIEFIDRYGDEP